MNYKRKLYSKFLFNQINKIVVLFFICIYPIDLFGQDLQPLIPPELRGRIDAERSGLHDANRIRTLFYNFGMVGDYPPDPLRVDLSVFHSVEIPKGSGENYGDGTTPFVLSQIKQNNGRTSYIMETGYRERQGTSPISNRTMRFEPRPGYFQADPDINKGRSVAISTDSRTWPDEWIDKLNETDDPGWKGYWNGYFGKNARADQESFVVYDDNFYDAWDYFPDSRDNTRRGLGLRVEQRGFQWANIQASYVIFFHYDITNESTTNYEDNIIFGLYMDSGVGGSAIGKDGIPESDDDNAYFDSEFSELNLVYTWDKNGNGFRGTTGYLGYAYLETPGNYQDFNDNDKDGITNERRDGGIGMLIVGQDAIRAHVEANYSLNDFERYYGPFELMPAYKLGVWWTGDEDLDWVAEFNDTGADGIFGTNDEGERDGKPTSGESNFDKTDIDESDQIGLTGFKLNRIRAGAGNPTTTTDQIVFFDDGKEWPKRLFNIFSDPDSAFGAPLALNYNIGFLFASGPFKLNAGSTERFSLALGFGQDLRELRNTTRVVQQIYKANYQFAVPPPTPTLSAFPGDGYVTLTWDNAAERAYDPITNNNDFEGYRIYRSTDPAFLDPQVILSGTGTQPIGYGKPLVQFDLINEIVDFSNTSVEGIQYFLGVDSGIKHTFTDSAVVNGQRYFYAITSYDRGVDSIFIYPSESPISVSQTLRGGTILPKNVVEVYPNPQVVGYQPAEIFGLEHSSGSGIGSVELKVLNPVAVPDNHEFQIKFIHPSTSVKAQTYRLINVTAEDTVFIDGSDLNGLGIGPVGSGIMPIISTIANVQIDSTASGFTNESVTDTKYKFRYGNGLPIDLRRPGYPYDIELKFYDDFVDTSIVGPGLPAKPAKFKVIAKTPNGDMQLNFRFRNVSSNGNLNEVGDYIDILTATEENPNSLRSTWRIEVDTTGQSSSPSVNPPGSNDKFILKLRIPFTNEDIFTFRTASQSVNNELAKNEFSNEPYVVPNPYVGAASFEPQRFAVSGRGERKIEFRNLPANCTIRIFTITGELVNTLVHDGNITNGSVAWDLRNQDQLEVAPGLYIYHVDGGDVGTFIGKFAIIK